MAAKKTAATKTASKAAGKKAATRSAKGSATPPARRWSAKVTTDSTKPEPGLFKRSARAIAEGLAKKSVSPEGPGQGMRMLNFYENRGGSNLSAERKRTLAKAKKLLHEKVEQSGSGSAKKAVKGAAKKAAKKATKKASSR